MELGLQVYKKRTSNGKRREQGLLASQCNYDDNRRMYQTMVEIALILGKHNAVGV